jgi:hypothetical protein
MQSTEMVVPTLCHHLTILYQNTAYQWIRSDLSSPALGDLQGYAHETDLSL